MIHNKYTRTRTFKKCCLNILEFNQKCVYSYFYAYVYDSKETDVQMFQIYDTNTTFITTLIQMKKLVKVMSLLELLILPLISVVR